MKISIINPENEKMGSSFVALLNFLDRIGQVEKQDEIIIDFDELNFCYPFLILPICACINSIRKLNRNVIVLPGKNKSISGYFEKIYFPDGFDGVKNYNFKEILNTYQSKTYLPICKIPVNNENIHLRSEILSTLENVLIRQLNLNDQMITVIKYLISEAIDNIVEHSGNIENGWIMLQNYPQKGFLDVCVVDTGIGIFGSYQRTKKHKVYSHANAIEFAINGKSTKQISETRGYGIDTSRRMLVDGVHGSYFLFSGNSFYVYTPIINQISELKNQISWNGTMIALRIPRNLPDKFNYTTFLE